MFLTIFLATVIPTVISLLAIVIVYIMLKIQEGGYEADKTTFRNQLSDYATRIFLLEKDVNEKHKDAEERMDCLDRNIEYKFENIEKRINRQVGPERF